MAKLRHGSIYRNTIESKTGFLDARAHKNKNRNICPGSTSLPVPEDFELNTQCHQRQKLLLVRFVFRRVKRFSLSLSSNCSSHHFVDYLWLLCRCCALAQPTMNMWWDVAVLWICPGTSHTPRSCQLKYETFNRLHSIPYGIRVFFSLPAPTFRTLNCTGTHFTLGKNSRIDLHFNSNNNSTHLQDFFHV